MFAVAFDYKRWADERTLRAVAGIDRAAFPEAWAFALQQLNHMVIVEELFRSRLAGEAVPHDNTNTEVVPPTRNWMPGCRHPVSGTRTL